MTQPWDYWHFNNSSLSVYNTRETMDQDQSGTNIALRYATSMLSARPFWVGDDGVSVKEIGFLLGSTAEPGTCRVGIYSCPPPSAHNMYPSDLVADLGELTLSGSKRPVLTATPIPLTTGFYYIATLFGNTNGITDGYGVTQLPGNSGPLGRAPGTGSGFIGFSTYQAYGALPLVFPPLVAGNFGIVCDKTLNGGSFAFYIESMGSTGMTITLRYDNTRPAGTAILSTDTSSSVLVRYGANTPSAVVAATLQSSSNLANVVNVGSTGNMPNTALVDETTDLLARSPIMNTNGSGAIVPMHYIPMTAISVQG